jgi:hypothetical protein
MVLHALSIFVFHFGNLPDCPTGGLPLPFAQLQRRRERREQVGVQRDADGSDHKMKGAVDPKTAVDSPTR